MNDWMMLALGFALTIGTGIFVASEVLAKHDEEYMPPEVAEAMKGIRHVPPSQQKASDGGY